MRDLIVWRHDYVRRKCAVSGNAGRISAHTAGRRKLLNDVVAGVEIDVARFRPAIHANLLRGSHGWAKSEIVAKPGIDCQPACGSPGILNKFAHDTARTR